MINQEDIIYQAKVNGYYHYYDNDESNCSFICNHKSISENDIATICGENIGSKAHFIRHLKNIHTINCVYPKNSKIYDAYIYIYDQLIKFNYDDEKLKSIDSIVLKTEDPPSCFTCIPGLIDNA